MSKTTLTVLTVLEIVALVAVLGIYLLAVAQGLRSIVSTLASVTFGARAVERQLRAAPANLRAVQVGLTDVVTVLPTLSDAIDRQTGRPTSSSAGAPPSS